MAGNVDASASIQVGKLSWQMPIELRKEKKFGEKVAA